MRTRRLPVLTASTMAPLLAATLSGARADVANPDAGALAARIEQGVRSHDFPAVIAALQEWAKKYLDDLNMQRALQLAFRATGDMQGWEQARAYLTSRWAAIKGTAKPPFGASFLIDEFVVGQQRVEAEQCYEQAGRFGVSYKFNVLKPGKGLTSFFTVESSPADNQMAKLLGQPTPVVTLDHFAPGRHETVAMMHGTQTYDALKARVVAYMQHPSPMSASSTGGPGLSNESRELAR